MKRLDLDQCGAVALEYALAVMLLAVPVFIFSIELYGLQDGYTAAGQMWAVSFQRILAGIALPVP